MNRIKRRDLVNLLNRAAAFIESPEDSTVQEIADLMEDLIRYADLLVNGAEVAKQD